MLATAVAMNLKGSSMNVKEEAADASPMVAAIMGGMNMRHYLSTGMAATPENCDGVPFNASHVYASGNLAADMLANVMAESTGRVLACRLYEMTDDAGMKDMISFLIARDTMHQQQWLAVLEELGGLQNVLPIPNSFPQSQEMQEVSYAYVATGIEGTRVPEGRFTRFC
jgi:Mn-containing catalase